LDNKFHLWRKQEVEVTDNTPNLPKLKRSLLERLVDKLSRTAGVSAIVLGGSYASGTHHEASDIDIGVYYSESKPFSIADIQRIAEEVSVSRTATVTGFYEWGAWVNGGAWLHTPHGKVDFLYRNLEQVQRTIAEAQEGITHHDYDQQPTHGFYIPLYDPEGVIAKLKGSVEVYPPKLKQRVIADSLWAAEFTLLHARGFAAQGDIYNTVGCLTRVTSNNTQALFALNERYFIRDKQVLETVATFPILPSSYIPQINKLLANPGSTVEALTKTVADLEHAWYSVVSLPGVQYEPKFPV
jgi:predicted nucleotidyltransferase